MEVLLFDGKLFHRRRQRLDREQLARWLQWRRASQIRLWWNDLCFEMSGAELRDLLRQHNPLGLDGGALKKSYRRLASLHHPDHGGALETMQRVNESYLKLTRLSALR